MNSFVEYATTTAVTHLSIKRFSEEMISASVWVSRGLPRETRLLCAIFVRKPDMMRWRRRRGRD